MATGSVRDFDRHVVAIGDPVSFVEVNSIIFRAKSGLSTESGVGGPSLGSNSPIEAAVSAAQHVFEVANESMSGFDVESNGSVTRLDFSSLSGLDSLVSDGADVLIDITGLELATWAAMLRSLWARDVGISVSYTEPMTYRRHPSPASPTVFEISERFGEVGPLPGFARLWLPGDQLEFVFVPILGFEGVRPRQIAAYVDPLPPTFPIVGMPGFRLGYPQDAIACNAGFIRDCDAELTVRFASADSPFAALTVLKAIRKESGGCLLIAPVGPRPHCLAAVMFALENPTECELIYDFPVAKAMARVGIGETHIYRVKERPDAGQALHA